MVARGFASETFCYEAIAAFWAMFAYDGLVFSKGWGQTGLAIPSD